uniref:(California timema) hypothetical protein n=1 Tax=Timema californicum TaxID=61474 RepID=A0A7R9P8S9_TIMCA|nr:unnamed protein product [Timema californicum]
MSNTEGSKNCFFVIMIVITFSGIAIVIRILSGQVLGTIFGVMALAIIFMIIWMTKDKATARHEESHSRGCRNRGLADQWTNDELRCGNVTERQTSHDMSSDANYNGLYLTIPPPLGFSGPESPPPSYEVAHVFDKPVQTPPPSYSAAVDLSGQPIWDHSYFPSQQHTPHVCDTHAHSSLHVDDTHSHSTSN